MPGRRHTSQQPMGATTGRRPVSPDLGLRSSACWVLRQSSARFQRGAGLGGTAAKQHVQQRSSDDA